MRKFKRGIFLITTLMLISFLVMLASSLCVSALTGMTSTSGYINKKSASDAALSGLNFLQAMLETNIQNLAPAPNGAAANTTIVSPDGSIQMVVKGWNVVGWVANTNTIGPGEQPLYFMFQATFNQDYNVYKASTTPPVLNNVQLPDCPLVSVNNLNRSSQNAANASRSYTSAGVQHSLVQGERADVVVVGYAVTPDGTILASRMAEGVFDVGQLNGFSGSAGMAKSDINLIAPNGLISVGTVGQAPAGFMGLSSYVGNILPQGTLPPVGGATAPPNYISSDKVALSTGKVFQYTYGGSTQDYTATDSQKGAPQPPVVSPADLPTLQNKIDVPAGTYVAWGGSLYHYPVDYAATNGANPPTAVPVQNQNWAQPDITKPPTLNGVAPDSMAMTSLDGGNLIPFHALPGAPNVAGNSLTITGNDVNVTPISPGGSPINSFTFVVAPATTSTGVTIVGNSAGNGSAQVQFAPSGSGTLQLRADGNINIMGNVTGSGSVQAVGTDAVSGQASNLNLLGKSSLDTRADSGVALYSVGQTNMFGLTDASGNTIAQLPSSVPQYQAYLALNPENIGTTGGGGGGGSAADIAISTALIGLTAGTTYGWNNHGSGSVNGPGGWEASITISAGGVITFSDSNNGKTTALDVLVNNPMLKLNPAQAQQFLSDNGLTSGGGSMTPTQLASEAAGGGTGGTGGLPAPILNQVFDGLIYAGADFNFTSPASLTVNGALVASTGTMSLSGANINLNYNTNLSAQFANLFTGGKMSLVPNSVTIY